MKKSLLLAFIALSFSPLFGQHTLVKLWESDSTTLKGPESALFDSKSKSLYISSMSSGTVVQMGLDGKVIKNNLVTGLNSNKGSAIFNRFFYTAETSAVAVIDLATGKIVKRIPVESAIMLNDLAVDSKGVIYVSDTRTGKVYRIEGDKPSVYVENIPGANGLLTLRTDLYIVGSTTFQKVKPNKEITKIAEGFESGLDAIVPVADNEFVLSNYKGILYYVNKDGTFQTLLDSRAKGIMANDVGYNGKTRTLYVPSFGTNRIIAYKLK